MTIVKPDPCGSTMLRLRLRLERRLKRAKIDTPLTYCYDEDHEQFRASTRDKRICHTIANNADIEAFLKILKEGCNHE